jgi:hypothetical protein
MKNMHTTLFLCLCAATILLNVLQLNTSPMSVALYGGLICIFLLTIIKKYWVTRRNVALLCIFLIFFVIGFPLLLLSIPS